MPDGLGAVPVRPPRPPTLTRGGGRRGRRSSYQTLPHLRHPVTTPQADAAQALHPTVFPWSLPTVPPPPPPQGSSEPPSEPGSNSTPPNMAVLAAVAYYPSYWSYRAAAALQAAQQQVRSSQSKTQF